MSYWAILGIDETADLRAVKRAYAAKLKKTKPDEDPEGFKALHAAYKWASRYAKANASREVAVESAPAEAVTVVEEAPPQAISQERQHESAERASETVLSPPPDSLLLDGAEHVPSPAAPERVERPVRADAVSAESDADPQTESDADLQALQAVAEADPDESFTFLQAQWEEMTGRIERVTGSEHTLNDLRSWRFLDGREALFDLQFKSELSAYLFGQIAECLQASSAKARLKQPVYEYLNSLFYWSDRRDLLEDEFGYEAVDTVLAPMSETGERGIKWTSPKFHKGSLVYANYYARMFATVIDCLVLFFAISFLNKLVESTTGHNYGLDGGIFAVFAAALGYLCLSPLMEATPLQGTLGKILFGMKVVSRKGQRLNLLHSLVRALLFGISMALIKITVWINFFSNDGRLIHDRMSLSIVVKR